MRGVGPSVIPRFARVGNIFFEVWMINGGGGGALGKFRLRNSLMAGGWEDFF